MYQNLTKTHSGLNLFILHHVHFIKSVQLEKVCKFCYSIVQNNAQGHCELCWQLFRRESHKFLVLFCMYNLNYSLQRAELSIKDLSLQLAKRYLRLWHIICLFVSESCTDCKEKKSMPTSAILIWKLLWIWGLKVINVGLKNKVNSEQFYFLYL